MWKFGAAPSDRILTTESVCPQSLTAMAWVRRSGSGGGTFGRIFQIQAAGGQGFVLATNSSNGLTMFRSHTGDCQFSSPNSILTNGTDYHVAITHDGSNSAGVDVKTPIIYLNGTSQSLTKNTNATGPAIATNTAWMIGNRPSDNIRNWNGLIGEVAIFTGILSAADISAIAAGASPLDYAGLICYIPLDRSSVKDYFNSAPTVTGATFENALPYSYPWDLPEGATPTLTVPGTQSVITGENVSIPVSAVKGRIRYSATSLPDDTSINLDTGVITGQINAAGVYTPSITANNYIGTDTKPLTIEASNAEDDSNAYYYYYGRVK